MRKNEARALTAGKEWGGGCDRGAGSVNRGPRAGGREDGGETSRSWAWGSGIGRDQMKHDAVYGQRAEWLRRGEDSNDAARAGGGGFRTRRARDRSFCMILSPASESFLTCMLKTLLNTQWGPLEMCVIASLPFVTISFEPILPWSSWVLSFFF